ncbi:MAG: hypothetical protein EOS28_23225 [Mesorhizobium sp.]|nr:MAG: hypothetical protein EOS28_23225 [Mesorhizobium sp.]
MNGESISPTDLRDFLKSQGWTVLERGLKDRLYVLENRHFPRRQLVYPMDMNAPDYSDSVVSVVEKFSEIGRESVRSLVYRINSIRDDILRLKLFSEYQSNSLPLHFASAVVASTEKLLKAAACTVVRPRANHPRLSLIEATQLVDKSRFGQTEEGSFVIQVSCPILSMDVQGSLQLSDSDQPFVRSVTLSLQRALQQLTTAIEADKLDELVDEVKSSSVPLLSANLCEAIGGMQDDIINNSLDISIEWSPLRKVPEGFNTGRVSIQRDYFARIEDVRRELRSVEPHSDDTFIGTVERLDGEMGADGRRSGNVILSLLLPDEGETVRARVALSAVDYQTADRAHMTNGAYVRTTGRLLPGRQPRQLTEMTKFELLSR